MKGEKQRLTQVPQRRDHVAEHLSLADDIEDNSELAEINSKIYHDLYSCRLIVCCMFTKRTQSKLFDLGNAELSKDIGSVHLELQCGHWAVNVLLIGAKVQGASSDIVQWSNAQNQEPSVLKYEVVSDEQALAAIRRELKKQSQHSGNKELSEQWERLSLCTSFMKIYNIQRIRVYKFVCHEVHVSLEFDVLSLSLFQLKLK
jgi:hypothetical protein